MSRIYLSVVAVSQASWESWEAGYDVRVNMQKPGAPVKVIYKKAIRQQTGEVSTFFLHSFSRTSAGRMFQSRHNRPPPPSTTLLGTGGVNLKRHRTILPHPDELDFDMSHS
jgi:hypothetical protein